MKISKKYRIKADMTLNKEVKDHIIYLNICPSVSNRPNVKEYPKFNV